jgi:hypothetical protein
MNPSASGWIQKFKTLPKTKLVELNHFNTIYHHLRANGFLYGLSQAPIIDTQSEQKLSQDEIEKINLISALYAVYALKYEIIPFDEFIRSVLEFYKITEVFEFSLWDKFIAGKDQKQQLERILHEHIQIDQNIFTKHFNKSTTNALLFIDVLGYNQFLNNNKAVLNYTKSIEQGIVNIINDVNIFKLKNNNTNQSNLKHIKESLPHYEKQAINSNYRFELEQQFNPLEKQYFLDIAALSIWNPNFNNEQTKPYIVNFGTTLKVSKTNITSSIKQMQLFYEQTKDSSLFEENNAINNFYDNTSQLVIKLIKRNSKRLVKEISQSKELMVLLSQSTVRDLSTDEQDKVQHQLLDVLKSIPSLAIFLLPGGAILLPIFVKLIPNLLPSSFNENKVDNS